MWIRHLKRDQMLAFPKWFIPWIFCCMCTVLSVLWDTGQKASETKWEGKIIAFPQFLLSFGHTKKKLGDSSNSSSVSPFLLLLDLCRFFSSSSSSLSSAIGLFSSPLPLPSRLTHSALPVPKKEKKKRLFLAFSFFLGDERRRRFPWSALLFLMRRRREGFPFSQLWSHSCGNYSTKVDEKFFQTPW